jgi:menaquinone-specific isochorismate synthase
VNCPATSAVSLSVAKHFLLEQLHQLLASDLSVVKLGLVKSIIRLEMPVVGCSPLEWLSGQRHATQQVYWSDRRRDFETAGIGCADKVICDSAKDYAFNVPALDQKLRCSTENVRYYGGLRFNGQTPSDQRWLPYGGGFFLLPQVELVSNTLGTYLACNVHLGSLQHVRQQLHKTLSALQDVCVSQPFSETKTETLLGHRQDIPDRAGWCRSVESALATLGTGAIDKIVLGRNTLLTFDVAPRIPLLLQRLKAIEPNAYHFYFQPQAGCGFMGATPERLYKRDHRFIESEAVAGTCPRGRTSSEDKLLGLKLLRNEKERHEHVIVRNDIQSLLAKYCHDLIVGQEPRLLKQSRVQHLYTPVSGQLNADISDLDLLRLLHPTPAVGGLPRQQALQTIAQLEPFDRGWFAGPVGWIGHDAAEFAVGIRSAIVNGTSMSLFAGAGVVRGSVPQLEWDELETKISVFMQALRLYRNVGFHAVADQ